MSQASQPQVLIVDSSEDSREVIQIALDRRGVSSMTATSCNNGLATAHALNPAVIVVDLDSIEADTYSSSEGNHQDFVLTAKATQSSLLLIGERFHGFSDEGSGGTMSKPYHFSALVNKIEEMLERRSTAAFDEPRNHLSRGEAEPAVERLRRAA